MIARPLFPLPNPRHFETSASAREEEAIKALLRRGGSSRIADTIHFDLSVREVTRLRRFTRWIYDTHDFAVCAHASEVVPNINDPQTLANVREELPTFPNVAIDHRNLAILNACIVGTDRPSPYRTVRRFAPEHGRAFWSEYLAPAGIAAEQERLITLCQQRPMSIQSATWAMCSLINAHPYDNGNWESAYLVFQILLQREGHDWNTLDFLPLFRATRAELCKVLCHCLLYHTYEHLLGYFRSLLSYRMTQAQSEQRNVT